MKIGLIIMLCILFGACSQAQENSKAKAAPDNFKMWTWITADAARSDAAYRSEFSNYSKHGIDAVLIDTGADPELLKRLIPLAENEGLEVHAWLFTLNRPGDAVAQEHPEWYAVSRDGRSTFDDPPYVEHYKFLCPTRKPVRKHVLNLVEELAKVEGIESVHLDFIRFPDVFLPVGLLQKYGLEQKSELPEYDFCYCQVCVKEFQKVHHKDPREMQDPALDVEWKQFRSNKIKAMVDAAYEIVHQHGKKLSAAVFPYPLLADRMVRQRWDKWNIDYLLPMLYHEFYEEDLDWIGFATRQGVQDLVGKKINIYPGLFLPDLDAEALAQAIDLVKKNGAHGVAFFHGQAFTVERLQVVFKSDDY